MSDLVRQISKTPKGKTLTAEEWREVQRMAREGGWLLHHLLKSFEIKDAHYEARVKWARDQLEQLGRGEISMEGFGPTIE
jgi:hypothetical protein